MLLVGVGGVIFAVGLTVFLTGDADRSAVEDAAPGTRWSEVRTAFDTAPTLLTIGQVVMGASIVMMAAGVTWLVLKLVGVDGEPSESAAIRPGPLGVEGRF